MKLQMSTIGCQLSCFFNWFSWMFSSTFAAVRLSLADLVNDNSPHVLSAHLTAGWFIPVIFHVFNSLEGYFNPFLWKDMDDKTITTGPKIYSIYSKIFCHSMIYHVLIALLNRAPKIDIWPKLQTWVLTIRMYLNLTGTCLASWRVSISLSLFFNVFLLIHLDGSSHPTHLRYFIFGKVCRIFSQWHGESNQLTANS